MKKVSIIIPAYGTEKYIDRCLTSVINQTYTNLEIIVVNDCSKGDMAEILDNYKEKDSRIKVITHEKNMGLFQARLTGSDNATGDYICFLDSDDYITDDYYRILVDNIESENSDVSVSTIVLEESSKDRRIFKLFEKGRKELVGDSILDEFFKQKGLNYSWHVVWNKLYTMDLWKKCRDYYSKINKHLIMTEDVAFSTVLMSNAKKITYTDNAYYYYCSNQDASTSLVKMSIGKIEKNINDLALSFNFVEDYLKTINIYDKYCEEFMYWKNLYFDMWKKRVEDFVSKKRNEIEKKEELLEFINREVPNNSKYEFETVDKFYKIQIPFNGGLELLKREIIDPNHKVISFDIFDTLISRPFYEPSDIFIFLNQKFNSVFQTEGFLEFNSIRKECEWLCRNEIWKQHGYCEVTLDEIYNYISKEYNLPKSKLNIIKEYEEDLELKYCVRRNTGYELFSLAKMLGKRVICTSDMYLSKKIITKILNNNGYYPDELYVSSELRKIKANGSLYSHVLSEMSINKEELLHIGDNSESDYKIPQDLGISAYHFPKAMDVFNCEYSDENNNNAGLLFKGMASNYIDNFNYLEYFGNRISLALVANKFFDNPFVSFQENSDFNGSPEMVGYYALGMHMFAVSKWLLDNTSNYDTISFMARDGRLLLDIANEMKSIYKKTPSFRYVYVSRKSLIPAILYEKINFYKIIDYVKFDKTTPEDVLKLLDSVIDLKEGYESIINKKGFSLKKNFKTRENFQEFMNIVINEFYNEDKCKKYIKVIRDYFNDNMVGKVANFDVGYSGQPEFILSKLLKKPIDTFFIHCNNENGFKNATRGGFNLNTFYQYRPVFTGTLREYLMSDLCPSCIGYKKDGNSIVPIFNKTTEQDYYDKEILRIIQDSAVEFTKDLVSIFGNDLNSFSFENYYMSVPFEYYLHLSKPADRAMFIGLEFDENVGEKLNLINFWDQVLTNNGYYGIGNTHYAHDFYMHRVNSRSKVIKILFYLLFDRISLKEKFKTKYGEDSLITKMATKFYRILKFIKHGGKK